MKDRMSAGEFRKAMQEGELIPSLDGRKIVSRKSRYDPNKSSNIPPPPGATKKGVTRKVIPTLYDFSKMWFKKGGIYIPFDVISKKNSEQIVPILKADGRPGVTIVPSKAYNRYMGLTLEFYEKGKGAFTKQVEAKIKEGEKIHVGMYFLRKTASENWDYQNLGHGPLDMMEYYGWIKKDSVKYIHPHYLGYEHDAKHPGIVIFLVPQWYVKNLLTIPKEGISWDERD